MRKKVSGILLVCALAGTLLSGCGSDAAEDSAPAESSSEESAAAETSAEDTSEDVSAEEESTSEDDDNFLDEDVYTIDVTYEEANILSFELVSEETTESEYSLEYEAENSGDDSIDNFSVYFSYLDADGNELEIDSVYKNTALQSGSSTTVKTECSLEELDEVPASVEITGYSYFTADQRVDVDLTNESAESYYIFCY